MTDTIKFIDVESPNQYHDKICQIGMVETDFDGNVLRSECSLVNPEADFFYINTNVHGITSDMVKDAPTLPEVWHEFVNDDHVYFVCHNACYDIPTLWKALYNYSIPVPRIDYADTKLMAQHSSYNFPNSRLKTVCDALGVSLDRHHNALCDATACMEVYWHIYNGVHSFKPYDYHVDTEKMDRRKTPLLPYEKFLAISEDVIADNMVTEHEARKLIRHITNHEELMSMRESSRALGALEVCIEDGYIDPLESDLIVEYLRKCIDKECH